ncbi:MAG TPA: transcription-repair coupling factor, partial [Actinomycetota bacterium]|nr:transcription-repair coupling factor [Actinomycetota bacterium]
MASLAPLLDLLPDERVQALLAARGAITVPDPARPFVLASLVRHLDAPVLAIAARGEEAEQLARDVHAFLGREGAEVFPGWEVLPGEPIDPSTDTMGRRLHALARLRAGHRFVVVTTAQGATQLVAPPGDVELIEIRPGATIDLDEISGRLVDMGYERNYIVERRGEFAIRGGILDVFPPSSERPVRAELWGDEVSSLR